MEMSRKRNLKAEAEKIFGEHLSVDNVLVIATRIFQISRDCRGYGSLPIAVVDGRGAARYNAGLGHLPFLRPPSFEREMTQWDESSVPLLPTKGGEPP